MYSFRSALGLGILTTPTRSFLGSHLSPFDMIVAVTPSVSSQESLKGPESDEEMLTSRSDLDSSALVATLHDKKLPFPWKLHQVLDESRDSAFSDILAWMPDGKSFKIFDKQRLEKEVMPQHFSSSKFKSFQRSLNLWGFRIVQSGKDKGQCYHPLFVKGIPHLCSSMERTKVKVPGRRGKVMVQEGQRKTPPNDHSVCAVGPISSSIATSSQPLTESAHLSSTTSFWNNANPFMCNAGFLDASPSPAAQPNHSGSNFQAFNLRDSDHENTWMENNLGTQPSFLAGLLSPPFTDRWNQGPLVDALHRFAALERIKQEQDAKNDAISNALLAIKLLAQHGVEQDGIPPPFQQGTMGPGR